MTDYLQEANTTKNQEDFLNRIAKAANRPRHTLSEDPFVPVNDLQKLPLLEKVRMNFLTLRAKIVKKFMLISMLLNQPILATLLMILSKKKRLKV